MTDAIQKAREALTEAIDFADQDFQVLTPTGEEMVNRWRAALAALDAETPATPADVGELVERLLHDHVQLGKMTEQASFLASGAVRVNDPSALMADLRDAATALERVVRRVAELEAENTRLRSASIHHEDRS